MPTANERVYCPIVGFTVWLPDGDSALAYDWEPLPEPEKPVKPSRRATHLPLRVRLNRQGKEIEKQEREYLKAWADRLSTEIRQQEEAAVEELEGVLLDAFQQAIIRRQLGVTL